MEGEGEDIESKYTNIEEEYQASEDADLYKFAVASLNGEMPKKAYFKETWRTWSCGSESQENQ